MFSVFTIVTLDSVIGYISLENRMKQMKVIFMKCYKTIVTGSCALLLALSSFNPVGIVLAKGLSSSPMEILKKELSGVKLEEGKQYTLQELLDRTSLTPYDKEQLSKIAEIQKEIFEEQSQTMFRSLVTNVYRHLSPSEVQDFAKTYRDLGDLTGLIPTYGSWVKRLYILSAEDFEYAADRGWGIDLLITLDPYNPTSTGMSFSYRYSY